MDNRFYSQRRKSPQMARPCILAPCGEGGDLQNQKIYPTDDDRKVLGKLTPFELKMMIRSDLQAKDSIQ